MTPEEIASRQGEITARMQELDTEFAGASMPEDQRNEFKELAEEREQLKVLAKELEARRELIEAAADKPEAREAGFQIRKERVRGDDIYDLSTVRASVTSPESAVREMKDRAKFAIEQGDFASESIDPDEARSNAERLLTSKDPEGHLARRFLETGAPLYQRAFSKALAERPLNSEEARALSTSNSDGGYALPFVLDPTVIHTNAQSVNPFRAISRVVQTTADNWNGITTAGGTARYTTEASEVGDDAPQFGQPTIHPERADYFVPFSFELAQDWGGLQAEITLIAQEAKDDLEATKFAFGTGNDQPQGVLIGGTATVTTAGTAALAVGDLYNAEERLGPRHRARATWVANRSIYNRIRQFDTAGGANLWTENLQAGLANQVPSPGNTGYNLIGYSAYEASTMGTTVATGGTVAVIGDFNKYVIVDRIGMSVELVPHLFATGNNRPSGQRGLLFFWRNSAKVVDPLAFRKIITL